MAVQSTDVITAPSVRPDLSAQDSNASAERSVTSRHRNSNGTFASLRPLSEAYLVLRCKAHRQEKNLENAILGGSHYDNFLDVAFLEGSESDWVPGDAKSGPLVLLPGELFLPMYLPSRFVRSARSICRYFDYDPSKKKTDLPWKSVREASIQNGPSVRKRVFKRRRLPKLNRQATDMKVVWGWIDAALDAKVLKVNTRDEAYELFRGYLRTYRLVNGQPRYDGYSSVRTPPEP